MCHASLRAWSGGSLPPTRSRIRARARVHSSQRAPAGPPTAEDGDPVEQVAADVAHIEPDGALTGPHPALIDDLLAGRFFSIDVRGQVTGWNPRAEAAFGWSTHHVSGQSLFDKLLVSGLGFGAS